MARKPKVYKDDDWTDDYFTRHKTEYKRPIPKEEEEKPLHPEVPADRPKLIPFLIDGMNKVSKALKGE